MTTQPKSEKISFKSVILPALGAIVLVVVALTTIKKTLPEHPKGEKTVSKKGEQLTDLGLKTLQGKTVRLSELGNKLTILNFWASWCDACVFEVPSLIKLRNEYKGRGLEIVGINLDENPDEIVPFLVKRLGIEYPVFVDPSGETANFFDVSAIPHTVIIDGDRKILWIETGERDWFDSEIRTLVEKWLTE